MNRFRNREKAPTPAQGSGARAASFELQALLDATVDAVIIIDHHGRIEVFNRSAERLFGYRAENVAGRNVSLLMTDRDRDQHDAYMARYLETGVPHIIGIGRDVRAKRSDGTTFPAFLSVGRIGGSDPPRFVGFLHDTTVREEALRAVQRERDRANQYLEVAQTALVALDSERHVSLINRKGCEILGRTEDELIGRDWFEVAVAPEDRAGVRAQLESLLENVERAHYGEYQVQAGGSERRLVAWRCIAVPDGHGGRPGVLCSGEDITERRAIEQAMERTRTLLHEAQSIAGIGNFELYDPASEEDYWSPQAYRIFGLDPARGRLSRDRSAAFVHPDDREGFMQTWRLARRSAGRFELGFRIVQPGGAVRFVQSRYRVFDLGSGRKRIAGTLHDVTERRRAEEEARQSQERLTHVARLATMGEMAAGVAHELNQPLAAVATYAQASARLLEAPVPDLAEVRGALQQIAAQALRAGEVIRRLRSLVRNQTTRREPCDASELVREVMALMETDARLHDVHLAFELDAGLPLVEADRVQIQQVVLNLVRNAIEAQEDNGDEPREVSVATRLTEGGVELCVRDNGPGIEPHVLERLFEPFCTTKRTGTGLGLAISRTIVEAHRGSIGYRPNQPRGACFRVLIPTPTGSR